ncbi:fatty acid desaturase [Nocardia kruczakiae]|uniref:fatty acid desaturase n=1 Tax=Nocardia kruczakiae TaxID=261477 RepID=UPI0007A3FCF5|nr:fatty acid desaturase [Nocardia kruczakiae]
MKLATRLPGERHLERADADRIAQIRGAIIAIGDSWRARHPWITAHQNHIGFAIFLVAIAGVVADGWLYYDGVLPWWVTIPLTGFWLSLLHELEHDLIHSMYFRNNRFVHNLMMLGVWFFRPSTINPWVRRRLHLHHHEVSGTDSDLEERAITNGEGWGAHRLVSLLDSVLGMYAKPFRMRRIVQNYIEHEARSPQEARQLATVNALSYFPLGAVHYTLWHLFLGIHAYQLVMGPASIPGQGILDFLAVAILAPNAVRTFCLHFVSSNMHYFGDVQAHNVLQQTQVWTAKWLKPFHALCFNFGETHAIHHFLVRDPFYIREAIKHDCQAVLRDNDVRFNDFGTFRRANRFALTSASVEP